MSDPLRGSNASYFAHRYFSILELLLTERRGEPRFLETDNTEWLAWAHNARWNIVSVPIVIAQGFED